MKHPLPLIFFAPLLSSCLNFYAGLVADKIVADQTDIESFQGRYFEHYALLGAEHKQMRVLKEIRYLEPGLVRVEVMEPAERAGELQIYDRSTITLWWPQYRIGIVIRGADAPDEDDYRGVLVEDTRWAWKNYRFSYWGGEKVAGRKARLWNVTPRRVAPLQYPYRSWVDADYTLPLALEIEDAPGHTWYAMKYEEITFDVELDRAGFEFTFPDDAVVIEWDLSDPSVPLADLREGLNFELIQPAELPAGLKLDKAILGRSGTPMATLLYSNDGRWLSLTEMHNFGRTLELGSGIPVEISGEQGYLNLMGTFSSLSWLAGGTALILMGNLPYQELVAVARQIQSSVPVPEGGGLFEIESYRGRYIERRADREHPIEREILFQDPGLFRVEVTAPSEQAGEVFAYDGEALTMWWPDNQVGVRIHGAPAVTEQQIRAVLQEDALWALRNYGIHYTGSATQAGREVDHWVAEPTRDAPFLFPYETWLDRTTALPLKHIIRDEPEHSWYSAEYKEITFGETVDNAAFVVEFPPEAIVFEWDLDSAGLSAADIQQNLNFALLQPRYLPRGLKVHKIIGDHRGLPIATLLMNRAGRWLSLTETRHFGTPLESGMGLPIRVGNRAGRLNLMGTFNSVSWAVGNTALTLIGNLPYPEMIAVAASVAPAEGGAEVEDLLTLESYRGRYVERMTGTKHEVVREVLYQAPGKARVKVVEPRSRRGETFVYNGSTLSMWWPRHLFGVRIRGATPPSIEQVRKALIDNTLWTLRYYDFEYRGAAPHGEREVDRWALVPKMEEPYIYPYELKLDQTTSLPLELEVQDTTGAPWYSMHFEELAVGEPVEERAFAFGFPSNAVVFEWDLRDPGLPLKKIQRLMNFRILLPRKLPEGIEVRKIVKGRHDFPMAVVLMDRGGTWLSLTEVRSTGQHYGRGLGIPIELGDRTGYLNFMGSFSSISWNQGNTSLILIGNLPYPKLIAIAASVGEPSRK